MQPEPNRNDEQHDGNMTGLQAILDQNDRELLRYLCGTCRRICERTPLPSCDADDLFQDVSIRVLSFPQHVWPPADRPAEWKQWLAAIARYRFRDALRKETRRSARERNYSVPQSSVVLDPLPGETLADTIMSVCKKYGERIQNVVALRLEQKPFWFIANELGMSESYARLTWYEAKHILRQELARLGWSAPSRPAAAVTTE
jgi:RNA polymerase sigma factor (sigma-70 family)